MSLLRALHCFFEEPSETTAKHPIAAAVETQMPDADTPTRRIVTAVAGLLARVAFADMRYSDAERRAVRTALARIHGLDATKAEAIAAVLDETIARGETGRGDHGWVRDLKELTDKTQRMEIVDVLLDLAAADGVIEQTEVTYLRRLTQLLGLDQRDYNALQARHRDKLGALRS